jgi:hypothetical protein
MIDPVFLNKWRTGLRACQYVKLPDGRDFRVMWRHSDQFGVRHDETGEQYSFTYQDAITMKLQPLILCPLDIDKVIL